MCVRLLEVKPNLADNSKVKDSKEQKGEVDISGNQMQLNIINTIDHPSLFALFCLLYLYKHSIFSSQEEVCHTELLALECRRGEVVNIVWNGWRGGKPRQRGHKENDGENKEIEGNYLKWQ